jgi:hypothetical protein
VPTLTFSISSFFLCKLYLEFGDQLFIFVADARACGFSAALLSQHLYLGF